MDKLSSQAIKIGVSSCLLGDNVRFDAGHKKNSYITDVLSEYFEFIPFCPEVTIGLGVPREPIHLVVKNEEVYCKGTKTPKLDVTEKLYAVADQQVSWHEKLSGYILKKDSPSCGMARVKLYNNGVANRNGVGLYAKKLIENFPYLPMEEEGRLQDASLRENFIQRVYIYTRWKDMISRPLSLAKLQRFHASHKYTFMSHDQIQTKELGGILAQNKDVDLNKIALAYLDKMMRTLKIIATRENHVNTLQHIQGYLKKHLNTDDKVELTSAISDYRNKLLPLIVPMTLLRHHFRKHPNDYITQSFYMSPYPGELMLLNHT